jgi:hypothetical protein
MSARFFLVFAGICKGEREEKGYKIPQIQTPIILLLTVHFTIPFPQIAYYNELCSLEGDHDIRAP